MWRPLLIILLIFAVLAGLYYYYNKPEITENSEEQINANKTPRQSALFRPKSIAYKTGLLDLMISPMARYSISARILSKRRYVRGWQSEISPWDIVFGWGDAAKMISVENLGIKQAVRHYSFRVAADIPMTGEYIRTHTSNNHIIPANDNIRKAILFLSKYDIVKMEGYLVNVNGKKGHQNVSWISSLSRNDSGRGSVEVFYVDSVQKGNKIYK
ncbi:MAG: hypothetical protein K9N09_01440 [Candidatus Cloacimonetes bacterium]|nr:hypothetical protein [Candidatus Cloacimonadota bacterium]MCF7813262.1 hypothetical protein [Candidatus Cloacimonadota bacterium]MCF7867337.1 hypothetical protein [Candidatus Cloacimonadota bacterium]MCF7882771.1 hypothetical protein [Candidatus Cloacimonadota bacterium]